jgi:MFS family permease
LARTVSQWGDAFATVALSLLLLDRSGSGLGVAGVVTAEIVPALLLAPVAGVLVDRFSAVRVMVSADVVRAVLAGLLPLVPGSVAEPVEVRRNRPPPPAPPLGCA